MINEETFLDEAVRSSHKMPYTDAITYVVVSLSP